MRFELSEAPIWSGRITRGVYHVATCAALDLETRKIRGSAIGDLARLILAERPDTNPNTPVEVWRGKTLCFHPMPISGWAELTVSEGDNSSVRLVKWTDMSGIWDKDPDKAAAEPISGEIPELEECPDEAVPVSQPQQAASDADSDPDQPEQASLPF